MTEMTRTKTGEYIVKTSEDGKMAGGISYHAKDVLFKS